MPSASSSGTWTKPLASPPLPSSLNSPASSPSRSHCDPFSWATIVLRVEISFLTSARFLREFIHLCHNKTSDAWETHGNLDTFHSKLPEMLDLLIAPFSLS